ncbi:MAG: 50S ribosomal protein L22 [Phycisphaerales bacterium]
MRIHAQNLKKMAKAKGLDAARLGEAVARAGMKGDNATAAVTNWMSGRDHPRCKASDIKKLAAALGCEVAEIAKFESILYYHRGSPRKANLLVQLIRGKRLDVAKDLLTFTTKRAAVDVKRCLLSAADDAERANADTTSLVVHESVVDEGPMMKRFQPKDRGRAHRILKRMSHIRITLVTKA